MEGKNNRKFFKALKKDKEGYTSVTDCIVVEEALQININGKPFTVTMRSPGSDEALVTGLLYTEGIYNGVSPLKIKPGEISEEGIPSTFNVWIPQEDIGNNYYQSRSMLSVSSCGICGKKELSDLVVEGKSLTTDSRLDPSILREMFGIMKSRQSTFQATGGSHAAAAFRINGELLAIEEDIGRHNAVDKVIGNMIMNKSLDKASCMLVSGRISFEIVSKTFKAKMPFLAAVSSPSSLSIETAEVMGISLIAFCRGEMMTCYTLAERLLNTQNIVVTP